MRPLRRAASSAELSPRLTKSANCRLLIGPGARSLVVEGNRDRNVFTPAQDRLFRAGRIKLLRDSLLFLLPVLLHAEGLRVWQPSEPDAGGLKWSDLCLDGMVRGEIRPEVWVFHSA